MKNSSLKNITDILQQSSLKRIVERSQEIQFLNRRIEPLLPSTFRKLYRIVDLYDNTLIIDVPNATIRQGFLLQHSQLLDCIQQDFPEVKQLNIKVNPNFYSIYLRY